MRWCLWKGAFSLTLCLLLVKGTKLWRRESQPASFPWSFWNFEARILWESANPFCPIQGSAHRNSIINVSTSRRWTYRQILSIYFSVICYSGCFLDLICIAKKSEFTAHSCHTLAIWTMPQGTQNVSTFMPQLFFNDQPLFLRTDRSLHKLNLWSNGTTGLHGLSG